MENSTKQKRTWQSPEIEVINSKMTHGGYTSWYKEDSKYYDAYAS